MEKNQKRLYAQYIYPAIYGKKYEEPVQLDVFDDELETGEETIDKSNTYARTKTQFQKGNPYIYEKQPDKNQINIDELEKIEGEEDNNA